MPISYKIVVLWGLIVLFALGSLFVLGSIYISPRVFWLAGVANYLIPLVIASHILVIVYGLVKKPLVAIPSGLLLVLVVFFILAQSRQPEANDKGALRFDVLSYNASFFHNRGRWQEDYESALMHQSSIAMKEWLASNAADIKCIQEFYNHDDSPIFNTINTIKQENQYDCFFAASERPYDWNYGLAIFSKFPIINSGQILFSNNTYNKAAYADLLIEKDTVRIINVHLQSMGLEETQGGGSLPGKLASYARKVKYGLMARSQQTEVLLKFVAQSSHKVIICGDMNELPFSNVYRRFKSVLLNAYEEVGRGMGFTYNHPWFFFLRIDHQFYDPAIKAHQFTTYRDMKYSENYPIQATYSFAK